MGMCTCTLCSLTYTLNVHYENLQFERVTSHVRDPSSNSMLLLTSSVYVHSFVILRLIVLELWWKQTDRQTYKSITLSISVEYLMITARTCRNQEEYKSQNFPQTRQHNATYTSLLQVAKMLFSTIFLVLSTDYCEGTTLKLPKNLKKNLLWAVDFFAVSRVTSSEVSLRFNLSYVKFG